MFFFYCIYISLLDDRVLYVTSVRRGYVTAGSVSPLMPVFVLSLMLFVWSVTEIHGDTVCTPIRVLEFEFEFDLFGNCVINTLQL